MRSIPRKIGLLAVLALAVGAACGFALATRRSYEGSDGALTIRASLGDQSVRLDLPTGGHVQHLAIWFHGQGGDVDTRMNQPWLNGLRGEGWAVASGDLAGNAWGNRAATDDAADLSEWAQKRSGQPVSLIVAGSMGALASLTAMEHGWLTPRCWYGTMPVLDLTTVARVPSADAQIRAAYDGPPPVADSPALSASPLPAIAYRVLASPQDTWVPKSSNADRLADRLPTKATLTSRAVSGEHGDPSHFDARDLQQFASRCTNS